MGSPDFPTLDFPLGVGVIHGDANVGNVLLDEHGQAVLIDLDSFSIGPREWDLIQTALFADRLGWHTEEEYRTFVEVYGYDITQWDGYETLADMREVAMTAWLSRKAADDAAPRPRRTSGSPPCAPVAAGGTGVPTDEAAPRAGCSRTCATNARTSGLVRCCGAAA